MISVKKLYATALLTIAALTACESDSAGPNGSQAASVEAAAGSGQTAPAGSAVAIAPQVVVRNAAGNAVQGVEVTFSVKRGGGSVTGATAVTNAQGLATAGSWTLGPVAGANELIAVVDGVGPAVFLATGTAATAASIAIHAGGSQSGQVGNNVAVAPAVIVRDALGNPVSGAAVTFAVASGGGSITGATATTSSAGIATVGSWKLGNAAGTNSLTATVAGVAPLSITALAVAGAPSTLAVSTGDNQNSTASLPVPLAPAVVVRDALGNPVPGVAVSFLVMSGGGSSTGNNAVTGPDGTARVGSWTLGAALGANTLRASVTGLTPVVFTANAIAGLAASIAIHAGNGQSATVGSNVATAPAALVRDVNGNPIAGITVGFAVTSGGGSVTGAAATTDAQGVAVVGSWKLGNTAGANMLSATVSGVAPVMFSATGTAGPAASLEKLAGDNGTEPAGTGTPQPTVIVRDAFGNPVSGVTVTFAVTSGGGAATGTSVVTSAAGIARVGTWTLGTVAGMNTMSATAAGVAPVSFSVLGVAGPPVTFVKVAGDNQTAPVGTNLPIDPAVLAADLFGNPVGGIPVSFSVTGGGGTVVLTSTTTGADGRASSGAWRMGFVAGANTLRASAVLQGVVQTLDFNATGFANSPVVQIKFAGDGQSAIIGNAVAIDPSVQVLDGSNNPVAGVSVVFTVTGGGGSVTGGVAVTNALGIATLGSWTLGAIAGPNTLRADVSGIASVTFTATANGPLVAVGGLGGGGTIRTSLDGLTWTERVSPFTSVGRAVAYNGSYWLAGAEGAVTMASSPDAITWTAVANPLTTYVAGMAFNGSMWVAVGSTGGGGTSIATSPDGVVWTPRVSPFSGATSFAAAVVWTGSMWVAAGSADNGDPGFATSPDGIVWTPRPGPFLTAVNGLAWNGSLLVAVGEGGTMLATSPDGTTWTARSAPFPTFGSSVAWNGSMWVAVGAFGTSIATSPDGITWTGQASAFIEALGVTWTGSQWVAVGRGAGAIPISGTSPDGITWTTAPNGFSLLATAVGWTRNASPPF